MAVVEEWGCGGGKGGQFMTWSGMQSPFLEESHRDLYTRGKLYTSSRKPCQSPGGGLKRGGPSLRPDMRLPQTLRCRPESVAEMPSSPACHFPSSQNVPRTGLSLSLRVGGAGGAGCSVRRGEQTQLTASFLAVNIAAPLRHGSGTRTPLHRPPTASVGLLLHV